MNRIKSFTINHNLLMPGFYISREDGDVITYDLRTRSDGLSLKQQSGGMAQSHIPWSICLLPIFAIPRWEMKLSILDRWDVRPDFICWFVTAEVPKKCLP